MDMDSGFCSRSGTPNIHTSNNSQCMDNNTKYEDNNMDSDSQVSSNNTDEIPSLKLSPILGDSNSDTSITTSINKRDYNQSFNYDNHKTNQENNYQFRRYNNNYNYGHQPRYHNAHHNGHYRHYNNRRHFQGQHHEFYHHHSNGYNHFHQNQQHQLTHRGMPNSMSTSTPSSGQTSNPLNTPEMDENLHPNILAARKTAPWPNSSGDHNNLSIGLPNTINKPYYTQQSSNTSDTTNSINFGNDNSANVNNASCGDIQSTTTTTINSTTNGTSANLELQNSSSNNITQDKYPSKFNQDNPFYYKKIHHNYPNGYMPRFPNNYRHYGGNKYGKHYHNDYYHHHNQHYHHTNNHTLNIIHGPPHTSSPTNGQAVVSSTVRDIDDNNLYPTLMSSKREEGNTWNSTDSADSTQPNATNLPATKATNFPNNRTHNGACNESTTLHTGGNSVTQNDFVNSRNLTRTELKLLNNSYGRDRDIYELNRSSNANNGSSISNPTIGISINTTNPLHTYQSYPGFFSVNNGVVGLRNGNAGNLYSQNCQNLHICEGLCDKIENSSGSEWSEENSELSHFNSVVRSVSPGGSSLGKEGNLINPKERFSNGPIVQHKYSAYGRNKKPYNLQLVPFDPCDIDPEERVKSFKFGEVTETPAGLVQHNDWDALSEAIWDKFATNQQTTETFRKKMELWRDVMDAVSKMTVKEPRVGKDFPNYGLQVVGSTMSGFGSNTSDVDICMLTSRFEVDQRFEAVDRLSETLQSFRSASLVGRAEIIYAKVPILKFRDANKGLEVDLNCNNVVGIRNTHLLYCYSQMDWRVKPLVLVVKLWAQLQGINDAKNMTVSSYSLVLMVIHYLQCGCAEPILPCLQNMYPEKFNPNIDIVRVKINDTVAKWESRNTESLGELLVGFLEYYSQKFDYTRNAVSVRVGSTVPIKSCMHSRSLKNDPHQWKYLCVEEPFDLTNTARSVYDKDAFDKIRGVFYTSWQRILISRDLESIFLLIPENEARSLASRLR